MNKSTGTIKVYPTKIVGLIDEGICDTYYSLIPAYFIARRPKHNHKITIVRSPPIETFNFDDSIVLDGKTFSFEYDSFINQRGLYFYLDCWSKDIQEIRKSLGLPIYRNGYTSYHITIGNVKP